MSRAGRPRTLRGRLTAAVLAVVVIGVGLLTAAFNLVLESRLEHDADALARARASAQLGSLSTATGRLEVGEAPDDAAVDAPAWVYSGRRALEHPRAVPGSVAAAANGLAAGPRRIVDVASPPTRLLAVPVTHAGRRLGTVVVAVSRAAYERTERIALIASLVLAAVLIAAVGLAARWLVGAALRPVARMTSQAAEWSERDLDRRFALGPPGDELTLLAATLDGLLDRLAAAITREQRMSSELSHELRTPLAKVSTRAQLLAGAPDLAPPLRAEVDGIVSSAAEMREVIEVLMSAARSGSAGGDATADVEAAARAVAESARAAASARGVAVHVVGGGTGARAAAEPRLVERILAPLVENACRHSRGAVAIRLAPAGSWLEVAVEDDGPGVAPEAAASIFEPGFRADAAAGPHDGAGLGLPLARRLASSAGGEVLLDTRGPGGRFVVRLPAIRSASGRRS